MTKYLMVGQRYTSTCCDHVSPIKDKYTETLYATDETLVLLWRTWNLVSVHQSSIYLSTRLVGLVYTLLIYESACKRFQEHPGSTKCKGLAPGLSIGQWCFSQPTKRLTTKLSLSEDRNTGADRVEIRSH